MANTPLIPPTPRFSPWRPPFRLNGYALGVTLVLTAGVLWSSAGIGVRLIESASGWQIIFYRSLGLIWMLSLIMAWRYRGRLGTPLRACGGTGLLCSLCVCLSFIANVYALLNTTVANVVLILSTTPFFAALLGWLLLKERVGRHTWQAIGLSVVGIALMVSTTLAAEGPVGMLFALAMTVTYAGFTVMSRRGRDRDMMPAFWLAGILAMLFSASMLDSFTIPARDLLICLLLGAFQVGLGLTLYALGARYVPAAELPLLAMTEVILAPFWVWIGVGEAPGTWTLIGGAVIMAGVTLQASGSLRHSRRVTDAPPAHVGVEV